MNSKEKEMANLVRKFGSITIDKQAVTRIQAIVIIAIVAVAAILGGAYWYVSQPSEPTEPTGPTTVRFWTDETAPESMVAWGVIEHNFEEAYPEYDFIVEYLTFTDIRTKVIAAIAAGNPPDICVRDMTALGVWEEEGYIIPLDDVMEAIGSDKFLDRAYQMCHVRGKVMMIPTNGMTLSFYIRQDWLDEKGLDAPTTWDEMLEVAAAFTEPEKGRYAWSQDYGDVFGQYWWWVALLQTGYAMFDEDGNLDIDNPGSPQAFQFLKDLNQYAPPGAIGDGYYDAYMRFVNGEVGMNWMWGRIISLIDKYNPDISDDVAIIPPPTGPGPNGRSTSHMMFEGYVIPTGASSVEGAKTFLTWYMSNFEQLNLILETVPGHLLPALKAAYDDPIYWDSPTMQAWKDRIIEGEMYLMYNGIGENFEHGEYQPDFGKVWWSEEILKSMNAVFTGASIDAEVARLTGALEAVIG